MVTADQNALCEKIAALADSMQPELLKFLEKPSIRIAAAMTQKTSTRSAFF